MAGINYFRSNNQFRAPFIRMRPGLPPAPRPMGGGNVTITKNVTIKNGPSGFWGFMTGLVGGLAGGFGMGMGMNMGMSMGNSVLGNGYGLGYPAIGGYCNHAYGTQSSSNNNNNNIDKKGNLEKMFPKYTIVDNGNGTYSANKDGGVPITGTYEDLCKKLGTQTEQGSTVATEPTQPTQATGATEATEPTQPTQATQATVLPCSV